MTKNDWHTTLRHIVWAVVICACFFYGMSRVFPGPQPVHAPVAVITSSPAEHEIQALEKSDKTISKTLSGVVSILEKPGATVLSKATGFTPAQSASILHGAKPHTATQVSTTVTVPTPAPLATDDLSKKIFNAAYAADTKALNETKINTTITPVETPTSRFGSAFSTDGATGLSFAAYRHKQIDINLAALLKDNHIEPAVCPQYKIPHTSLDGGPCVLVNHGVHFSFGITEQF